MANINPLDMPEIRNLVRRFLTRTDLVCCLRVCKAWRSSYLPFVWSIASIQQEGPNPTIESLNHYREFVKGLSYDVVVGSECMSIEFPILKRLEVYNKPGTQVWKFPCGLNNLKELRVAGLELTTENAATTFWSLCTQLELLHAENMIVAHLPEKSVSFDRLVNLSLSFYTRIPRTHQAEWMEWINQCRNIVFLDLCYPCTLQSAIDAFVMRFAAGTWSKVQELALRLFKLSDEDLARVIGGMHKATVLDIRYCTFAELSLTALRRHYQHLRYLDIWRSETPTSCMVAEIMASCPRLESLSASHFTSQDIINSPPWICGRSLRYLHVGLRIKSDQDTNDHQRCVLERISQLVSLETLFLSGLVYSNLDSKNLHLGLECGLEQLITLQSLDTLILSKMVNSSKQQLTEADVKWMVSNWKNLRRVYGYLSIGNNGALGSVLEEAGIKYSSEYQHCFELRDIRKREQRRTSTMGLKDTEKFKLYT